MSFLTGVIVGAFGLALVLFVLVLGVSAGLWVIEGLIVLQAYPAPVPVRVRTAAEQWAHNECQRTIRPGTVRYTIVVKPD